MKYRDEEILKCSFQHQDRTKYYIVQYHKTGIMYSEDCLKRYHTLKDAKQAIDEDMMLQDCTEKD